MEIRRSDTSPLSFLPHLRPNFESAADAIVTGDITTLRKLLQDHPDLVHERSTREHHSTLLHYVSANGVEDFRQKTPGNIVEIANLLIDAGADVNAESDAYGGGCTTLGLVATSVHPEQAGVQIALLQALLDRGARLDHPSPAGNRHSLIHACLANGQPKAAEFFASLGVLLDLPAAAALGRPDIIREQLESAFGYAAWYGQTEIVEFLLKTGIDPGLRSADGRTCLHRAAYGAHVDVVKLLLAHSAPVDVKDDAVGVTPLDIALWLWDRSQGKPERERCYEIVTLLVSAGAKPNPRHLDKINSDPRMRAALDLR
jgi:ankyrin repeat protein